MKHKIGLALSGGGVKGAVHAGMIHFFDEIGFKPDVIAGTSAGAIVGAFYANGMTGKEIFDFFLYERPFSRSLWAGSKGIINTAALRETFENYLPHDRFEALPINLVTTATNMLSGNSETFREGPLISRVLASASFPGVFSPMEMDGILWSDGGILNNFPVDVIRNECEHVIGMYLSPNKSLQLTDLKYTSDILSRTIDIQGSQAEYNKLKLCDIGMYPENLVKYGSFDFNKAKLQEMFDLGYELANSNKTQLIHLSNTSQSNE